MIRIITRPDFDGVVCAAMILEALEKEAGFEDIPILWLEPSQIQHGNVEIQEGDIMANLPYDVRCSVWFDHHVSNDMEKKIEGLFRIADSAAGLVYEYYKKKGMILQDFDALIRETDIIDAARLTRDQVLHPENYPYILLSMSIKNRDDTDPPYWNKLVTLLRTQSIEKIHDDPEVKHRCLKVIEENRQYEEILKEYTTIYGNICVTDFRSLRKAPSGNRFLPYSLFSDCIASMKIRYDHIDRDKVLISVGKSIFKSGFNVNIGKMLSRYGGGGHAGAGGCTMIRSEAQQKIHEIIEIMKKNEV